VIAAPRIRRRQAEVSDAWPDSMPEPLRRVYAHRGLRSGEESQLRLARLLAPDALAGLDAAVSLLRQAIASDRRIVVVGDFDCDGATGTAVAVRGLGLLGARSVAYRVPNRMVHGYGLSPALVEELRPMRPDLLLTVDSGIACHAGVAAAKACGWQVLVTDHHLPGRSLPSADAILNPNLAGDGFPSKALAGVGVAFYLLLALRRRLRDEGAFADGEPDLAGLLDLVAIGTVADLVPLDYNNRLLVAAGLQRIRRGQAQPGVLALAEVAGRGLARFTASDIGFAVAPRLNAAGRLEDMSLGIECLLTDDPGRARQLATLLDGINAERKGLQQAMVEDAEALLASVPAISGELPPALVLHDARWHPGIVGLVASRIKDRVHRPVIALAPIEGQADGLRGSARSIPGFHVRDALALVDARHPGLIERFGGHAMAAGLTVARERLADFDSAFMAAVAETMDPALLQAELLSDGELDSADINRSLAEALRLAGPWGQGFPEPLFDGEFELLNWFVVAEKHLKLSIRAPRTGRVLSAIHFGGWAGIAPPPRLRIAYQLELDDYRGRNDVQLLVRHWEAA
jgi:single-stranded-DNA-specific exonuclease